MLTDLRLQKYLQGRLSPREERALEALLEKNPDLRRRLEELEQRGHTVTRPIWERLWLEKGRRKGSRVRASTFLPALLLLAVILMLSGHWFSKPGANSTFTLNGGNGTALELLYDSPTGWRYLDAGFRPEDSLTVSIHDNRQYHVSVVAIYGQGPEAKVATVWKGDAEQTLGKMTMAKPVFRLASKPGTGAGGLRQFVVFYDEAPLPDLSDDRVLDLLASHGNERGGLDFHYQIFSAAP
jgi:hypothetical protein